MSGRDHVKLTVYVAWIYDFVIRSIHKNNIYAKMYEWVIYEWMSIVIDECMLLE